MTVMQDLVVTAKLLRTRLIVSELKTYYVNIFSKQSFQFLSGPEAAPGNGFLSKQLHFLVMYLRSAHPLFARFVAKPYASQRALKS